MYAIIKTGGKQYRVEEDQVFSTEKIGQAEEGNEVSFDRVLMISDGDDSESKIGRPYIDGAEVKAEVLEQGRGEKVTIFKYKKRKRYRKKIGHKQPYTKLKVTDIKI